MKFLPFLFGLTCVFNAGASGDWPLHGLDRNNHRLADITEIDAGNVGKLERKWTWHSGVKGTFQTTPIVVGGVMYVSLPFSHVAALDADTGKELWRYQHQRRRQKMCCGPANRGVAVANGRVFVGTVDARLIALDAKSGKVLWDVEVAPPVTLTESGQGVTGDGQTVSGSSGIGIAAAPMVFEDRVLVGVTGLGYGLHLDSARPGAPLGSVVGLPGQYGGVGFLAAFDVASGQRVWKFDTVRSPEAGGWEGEYRTHTPDGVPLNRNIKAEKALAAQRKHAWKHGGGSVWNVAALDDESGLLFFGVGNPSPQMDDSGRPGDNLYTSSLVAIDARSGAYRWHYQQVPHDLWGYDLASAPVLFSAKVDGKNVPAVGHASKLGWFYAHERTSGRLLWKSEAFVPQENLFAHATRAGIRIAPGVGGGANWSPVALDADRGKVFIAAMHMPTRYYLKTLPATKDEPAVDYASVEIAPEDERWGVLAAIDLNAQGRISWTTRTPDPLVGGVLALKSGVIFTGEGDGNLSAFSAQTGKRLWQHDCGAGANAPPIAYRSSDGEPRIAVAAGGSALWGYQQGDTVVVFGQP
tara:strand:- start:12734 stop:14476 length:1743 start_codon:yes stop_codon:yes gene_type:complete